MNLYAFVGFFRPCQNIGDDHFMGLLIQFGESYGPYMIVPPLNTGGFEEPIDDPLGYHDFNS
jgi:hypothetical protein